MENLNSIVGLVDGGWKYLALVSMLVFQGLWGYYRLRQERLKSSRDVVRKYGEEVLKLERDGLVYELGNIHDEKRDLMTRVDKTLVELRGHLVELYRDYLVGQRGYVYGSGELEIRLMAFRCFVGEYFRLVRDKFRVEVFGWFNKSSNYNGVSISLDIYDLVLYKMSDDVRGRLFGMNVGFILDKIKFKEVLMGRFNRLHKYHLAELEKRNAAMSRFGREREVLRGGGYEKITM